MPLLHDSYISRIRSYVGYVLTACGAVVLLICAYDPDLWGGMMAGAVVQGTGMYLLSRNGRLSLPVVLGAAVLARAFLIPLPPVLSDDAYRYLWDGLLQIEGVNPYLFVPSASGLSQFRDTWIFPLLNSADYYTVYPPVSQFVYAFGALFQQPESLSGFYAIKAVMLSADLGAVYLLSRLVPPRQLVWYAWHPLVWLEFAGQAHQEALMIFFLVVCYVLLQQERGRSAVGALTLAGWVKLYPFLLLPFLLRRTRWRYVWIVGAVTVLAWAPYAHPDIISNLLDSLELYVQLFEFNAGPYYGAKYVMYFWTGADWSKTLGPMFAVLFGGAWLGYALSDYRRQWRWPTVVVVVFGTYLALSTTVHPWYVTGVLAFIPLLQRKNYAWPWLGLWSIGTYLFYQGGPYWTFIWIGWSGWAVLLAARQLPALLDAVIEQRAEVKWQRLAPYVPENSGSLLDLGAGEGYVGRRAANHTGAEVVLADLIDMNRTGLPFVTFDGRELPVDDDRFDTTLLVYVLHHARDADHLLDEARRVTNERIVILESVYENAFDRWTLTVLDHMANSLRFMRNRTGVKCVKLRTADQWIERLEEIGHLAHVERLGRFPHKQVLLVVDLKERAPKGSAE